MIVLTIITLLTFFLYFLTVQVLFLYITTHGDTIREKISNFLGFFGNREMIKGETSVPIWEYRFLEVYNNWLDRFGSDGKVTKMREYEEKPKKLIAYISLLFTTMRMVLFPFKANIKANISWFKRFKK